jgi:serine protease Do
MMKRTLHVGLCLAVLAICCQPKLRADDAPSVTGSESRMTAIVRAVERCRRSTVNIHSEKRARTAEVLFSAGRDKKVNGMGTGIIVDERGYIVTNHHVVHEVESLRVSLFDGNSYDAHVVSYDSREDLAIIKIDADRALAVMPFGTSSDLMLGEDVLAIGNAFGYEHTVTRGIISQLGRDVDVNEEQSYRNLIQTDAAINPGNSGGPLLNRDGDVIGINVAIRAGAQRIGFAIPIDDARVVIARLLNIERLNQNYHGLNIADIKHGADRRLVVRGTQSASPAAASGFEPGDVVMRVGSIDVMDAADLERALLGRHAGESVRVVVDRDGQKETLNLTLARVGEERRTPARETVPDAVLPQVAEAHSVTDVLWNRLGLRISPVSESDAALTGQPYRGGLRVVSVRGHSPASQSRLQEGDILVGLHVWETISPENVSYVLNHPQFPNFNPLKFYVLRGSDTLFGHFQVSATQTSHTK